MFDIDIIATAGLGDRSYLASDGHSGVVIDPQRDTDRVQAVAAERGVRITHVMETHIHNDYLTGGLALAQTVGARYVVAAADRVDYARTEVTDGDIIVAGQMRFQVMHTPGHTHHHLAYVLRAADDAPQAAFTGGSMLFGSTGRTDLLGAEHTDALTREQHRSVRRLTATLPAPTRVLPTHGFGSFCSAGPTSGDTSTIGEQLTANPALTHDEDRFVAETLAGLGPYPAYYSHMAPLNSAGPIAPDLSTPELVDLAVVRSQLETGTWVVDLRERTVFAAHHLRGTRSFELADPFVTYLGWLHPWDRPLTIIGDPDQLLRARRELARIGIDHISGALTDTVYPAQPGPAGDGASYRVATFAELAETQQQRTVHVLDTRLPAEHAKAALPRAQHIALHELPARVDEVIGSEVWVHCGSGYRAAIAASLLEDGVRTVVLVDDNFAAAIELGLSRPSLRGPAS